MQQDQVTLPLAQAIQMRKRPMWSFDASSFLLRGIEYPKGEKVRIRIATIQEQDEALEGARRYVESLTKDKDFIAPEMLRSARIAYLMHRVCFDGERDIPAFPSGRWLVDNLTADELEVLLHHHNECLRVCSPIDFDLSDEKIEGLAIACAMHADTDKPNKALAVFSREQIVEIAIRMAVKVLEARSVVSTESARANDQDQD